MKHARIPLQNCVLIFFINEDIVYRLNMFINISDMNVNKLVREFSTLSGQFPTALLIPSLIIQ